MLLQPSDYIREARDLIVPLSVPDGQDLVEIPVNPDVRIGGDGCVRVQAWIVLPVEQKES